MKRKKQNEPKSTQATALRDKIKAVILGDGIRRRIEADAALPAKYPRGDGVLFLPEWQDDFIDRVSDPAQIERLLVRVDAELLARS